MAEHFWSKRPLAGDGKALRDQSPADALHQLIGRSIIDPWRLKPPASPHRHRAYKVLWPKRHARPRGMAISRSWASREPSHPYPTRKPIYLLKTDRGCNRGIRREQVR